MQQSEQDRGPITSSALAFVAGFVDAAAFIALTGLFTAHVTGNFVLIGAELASSSTGVLAKLLALPVFMGAVAATRLIALALQHRAAAQFPWLLTVEAALLSGFGVFGTLLSPLGSPDGPAALLVGMLAVASMGVQNAIGRLSLGHLAPTTVMTVSVTQAVIDAMDLALGKTASGAETRARFRRTLPAIVAFAAGALAGAFGIAGLSFASAAIPVLILCAVIVPAARSDRT